MMIDQYRAEPADQKQRAAWMRMIVREAYRTHEEREICRAREDAILANPERFSADLVGSIRDHRAAEAMRTGRPARVASHWGFGDTSRIGLN